MVGVGESFKTIARLYTGKEQALARVALTPASRRENHRYILHPLITNSTFFALGPLLANESDFYGSFLPFGIKDIFFQKTDGFEECWLLVRLVKDSGEMILFDAEVIRNDFQVVVHYSGCSLKRVRPLARDGAGDPLMPEPVEIQHSPDDISDRDLETTGGKPEELSGALPVKFKNIWLGNSKRSFEDF